MFDSECIDLNFNECINTEFTELDSNEDTKTEITVSNINNLFEPNQFGNLKAKFSFENASISEYTKRKEIKSKPMIFVVNNLSNKSKLMKRKFKTDEQRKKHKCHFHLYLLQMGNTKLSESQFTKKKLKRFPQAFIANATKLKNKPFIEFTYENLLLYPFEGYKDKDFENNIKIVKFIRSRPQLKELNEMLNKTYNQLHKEYLESIQFESFIEKMKEKGEGEQYINFYLTIAKDYINFIQK